MKVLVLLVTVLMATVLSAPLLAGPAGPVIMIKLAQDQCPESVRERGGGGNGDPKGRCTLNGKRQSDAVCKAPGNEIAWRIAGNPTGLAAEPFSITFKDPAVHLLDNCSWTTGGKQYECEITSSVGENTFPYNITVNFADPNVPACVLDPRIIITNNVMKRTYKPD